ncbi:lytic transglycosylase domain-containing protein [Thiobaca trueperi]|nr:lytic transglycosylase domain-containing protein [Thiobaca trueperi]
MAGWSASDESAAARAETAAVEDATPATSAPVRPAQAAPPSQPRPSRAQVKAMIPDVARRYGVEESLVHAVVAAESNYNAHAVSHAGAVGLMQVMPATAADYGVSSADALFDPETNLRTGTRHLKRLLNKYKNDYGRVIMAYNAGEGVVDRTNSQVTYLETLNYTEAVINNYRRQGGTAPTQTALKQVRALRGVRNPGQARRLMKKYLDPSLLSLKVKPTLDVRLLNPALHDVGPESRPMFELDARASR